MIHCASIVRCRACRTYINPFVFFIDTKRWKCNLCFRTNERNYLFVEMICIYLILYYVIRKLHLHSITAVPDEFQFDPLTKSYGDPSRRPEIRSSTIEFIAPGEYMVSIDLLDKSLFYLIHYQLKQIISANQIKYIFIICVFVSL